MCWSGHRDMRDAWDMQRQTRSSRRPEPDVRVSDAERQATIDALSRHTGEGRLTLDDFETRLDEAWQAKTRADLRHVLRELPADPAPAPRRRATLPIRAMALWMMIAVVATIAWGAGVLWWLVPLAWFRFAGVGRRHRRERWRELRRSDRDDELTLA